MGATAEERQAEGVAQVSEAQCNAAKKSCCPAGALPKLDVDSNAYDPQGKVIQIHVPAISQAVDCYVIGDPKWQRGIVLFHDVFGPNSGHHRAICDRLAMAGYYVIMPDFYEGGSIEPYYIAQKVADGKQWLKKFDWPQWCGPIMDEVYKYLYDDLQLTKLGCIGFCWGAWLCARASHDKTKMHAAVWMHPSCQVGHELYGEGDERDLTDKIQSPTLIVKTPQDPDMYLPNGELLQILKKNGIPCDGLFFRQQTHGFMTRAAGFLGKSWEACGGKMDLSEHAAVNRGINVTLGWIAKYLDEYE